MAQKIQLNKICRANKYKVCSYARLCASSTLSKMQIAGAYPWVLLTASRIENLLGL